MEPLAGGGGQAAAIALAEKDVPFERRWVDLSAKPDWFKALSPLGKVPLLHVGLGGAVAPAVPQPDPGATIFESAVILEYLEETQPHPLHPSDPLERARHRAWMEFGSAVLNAIARLYNAPDNCALDDQAKAISAMFDRIEEELSGRNPAWMGPFFAGERFTLVDAVFGPVFRYFDTFESAADLRMLEHHKSIADWRAACQNAQAYAVPSTMAILNVFSRFYARRKRRSASEWHTEDAPAHTVTRKGIPW